MAKVIPQMATEDKAFERKFRFSNLQYLILVRVMTDNDNYFYCRTMNLGSKSNGGKRKIDIFIEILLKFLENVRQNQPAGSVDLENLNAPQLMKKWEYLVTKHKMTRPPTGDGEHNGAFDSEDDVVEGFIDSTKSPIAAGKRSRHESEEEEAPKKLSRKQTEIFDKEILLIAAKFMEEYRESIEAHNEMLRIQVLGQIAINQHKFSRCKCLSKSARSELDKLSQYFTNKPNQLRRSSRIAMKKRQEK
ncbi:hypothetical protein BGZ76_000748 [Entomortierella beljakovae]|nr:hypothetical protein BGZ76_000748 [Entomortierella beljakovae]